MIKKNSISLVRLGYSDITSLTVRICSDILEKSFKDNDYSTKRNAVYLALEKKKEDGKYRYIWSEANNKRLDFLSEKFNISVEYLIF